MKIAQVCPYNIFRAGGVQQHILDISRELERRGHEVVIFAPYVEDGKSKDNIRLLGKCSELSLNKTQIEVSVATGGEIDEIRKELRSFDIVHFHEPWVPVLSIQMLMATEVPKVATFHSASPQTLVGKSIETLFKPIASYVVQSLEEVICVSDVPAKYIKGFYTGNIHIIPNGLDLKVFNVSNEPFKKYKDGKINIFFIGRLDKRKGVIYLLKAFRKLKKRYKNVRLIIGGKGDEYKKLSQYVKKHEIPDVELLGYVSEEDKPRYFTTCDIFCSPALYGESFGIVLAEAMASGKPVIAGDNPGYRSVLNGRGELLVINPKKTDKFTELLEIFCKDSELREIMGEWGISRVKNFEWSLVCSDVLKVYDLARKGKTRRLKRSDDKEVEAWLEKLNGKLSWGE